MNNKGIVMNHDFSKSMRHGSLNSICAEHLLLVDENVYFAEYCDEGRHILSMVSGSVVNGVFKLVSHQPFTEKDKLLFVAEGVKNLLVTKHG